MISWSWCSLLLTASVSTFLSNMFIDWFYPTSNALFPQQQSAPTIIHTGNKTATPLPSSPALSSHYREKRILIDGKSQFSSHLTNLYDVDVSNSQEVEFLVYSAQSRLISWVKRDGVIVREGPVSLQWYSNFWIYLIMFIYIAALVSGMYHFSTVDMEDQLVKGNAGLRKAVFQRDVSNPNLYVSIL